MIRLILSLCLPSLLVGCYNHAEDLQRLLRHHEDTIGKVVYLDCANHGSVYYSFMSADREIRDSTAGGNLDCWSLKKGDPLKVYFNPEDPRINTTVEPQTAYENAKGWYFPEWWFVVVIIVFSVFYPFAQNLYAGRNK